MGRPWATIGIDVEIDGRSIENVVDISGLSPKASYIDTTTMKDDEERQIPGVKSASNITVTFLYDNSTAESDSTVLDALDDGEVHEVVFTYPDGAKFKTKGYCTTALGDPKIKGRVESTLEIARTEKLTKEMPAGQ